MNQTILSYLRLLIWPALIIFLILWFRATIRYLLHERLTRIDAGGISAQFEKVTSDVVKTVDSTSSARVTEHPKVDLASAVRMSPRTYMEARPLGEAFRSGKTVILDLQSLSDRDAARLVDFCSGYLVGVPGWMFRAADRVIVITPIERNVTDVV